MGSTRGRKPSPSMIVALVALFVALAGTAFAAGLAKNSVKSKQIKDGAVASVDVKDNGLTGTDINEESLTGLPGSSLADSAVATSKIADGAVTTSKIADGAVGGADLAANSVDSSKVGAGSLLLSDMVVASITFDLTATGGNLAAHTCSWATKFPPGAQPYPQSGDISIAELPPSVADDGRMVQSVVQNGGGDFDVVLCNVTAAPLSFAGFGTFPVYVIRP